VVSDLNVDIERTSSNALPADPFQFRDGLKTEGELAEVRRRKKGKQVEQYHRRQNDVWKDTEVQVYYCIAHRSYTMSS
jgi:hypothetical protein